MPEVSQGSAGGSRPLLAEYLWHSWAVRGLSANPSVFVYMCVRVPQCRLAQPGMASLQSSNAERGIVFSRPGLS